MEMKEVERDDFWHLEHDGWEKAARNYERCWTDHSFPFIPPLLQATDVSTGTRLLDLACGPGYVSEQAGSVGANPVGVDFSRHMIQAARRRNPRLDFCEADAHQLPFQSRSFDAVTMNFGVLHLSHPESAFAEIFRVLRPTGRFGFTVWAKPDQNPGNRAMSEAIEDHADTSVELPAGPPYFRFCDVQECLRVTREAGFVPSTLTFTTTLADWTVPSADALFEAERDAGVRTAALLARQSAERLAGIRTATREALESFATEEGYAIPLAAHIVSVGVRESSE